MKEIDRKAAYWELLSNPKWHERRSEITRRDGNRCRVCHATEQLHVHHRQYHKDEKSGEFRLPWAYCDDLLITLCATCHEKGHKAYTVPTFQTSIPHESRSLEPASTHFSLYNFNQ